jgi:hypothetical protein
MRHRASRFPLLVVALALVAGTLVGLAPTVTSPIPAGAAVVATNSDPDYATVEFSDPWDYSNAADFTVQNARNLKSWSIANGVLDAQLNQGGGLVLAQDIPGAVPTKRSTRTHPVNANNLTKVAFRMWSSTNRSGGFFWYSCSYILPSCENGFPYQVQAGWHDYEFDIPAQATFPERSGAWAGTIRGLRFTAAGGGPNHIFLDWFRLVPASASSAPPSPVVPLPVVDSPSVAGGIDYATLVRHNPWDMSAVDDIRSPENMAYGFSSGVLNGLNGGAHPNDAHFTLPQAGAIDGNRWHRLSFRVHYEGPFGLGSGPGGGMVARLIWQTAGAPAAWQDSEDIVVYPGWNEVSLDLATSPPSAITDTDTPFRIGWAGRQITGVRFDPHEDIGQRRFLVDNVKIAEDATGYGGSYDIKFHDNAWRTGTTADIYVTPTRGGFGGTPIATGLAVNQGVNTFRWAPSTIPNGAQWVYVVLHRGANTARAYADGPLRMTSSPSPIYGVNPFGRLDSVTPKVGNAVVRGWAIDPNTAGPIGVHVYVDGKPFQALTANGTRNDIGSKYPPFGPAHGYSATLKLPSGRHTICTYGINVGPGTNQQLGCKAVTLPQNPFGKLDVVESGSGGIQVSGWAIDPDTKAPISVHLYMGGRAVRAVTADVSRRDLIPMYGYGGAHGFATTLPGGAGNHTVCAYGINRGPGANTLIGCKTG